MSLTDERIMELAKLNCSIHGHVFPTQFARAIEAELCGADAIGGKCCLPRGHNMGNLDIPSNHQAEATKPCACGDSSLQGVFHRHDGPCYIAVEEATKPQEPVAEVVWFDPLLSDQPLKAGKIIDGSLRFMDAVEIGTQLYTAPQPCLKCADAEQLHYKEMAERTVQVEFLLAAHTDLQAKCAELEAELLNKEGMALVTKEDAENYCRILSLLGMEEEGSPIEGVEHLISLRDGMTCGDCNDTGWLENREEGRYPCTCMTEAEPYQILEAKCAELEAKVEQLKMVPMKYRRMEFNAQLQRENMELRVERDALAAQLNRVRRALDAEP